LGIRIALASHSACIQLYFPLANKRAQIALPNASPNINTARAATMWLVPAMP
jgi:hypothetical protein